MCTGATQLQYLCHVEGIGEIAVPEARMTAIRNFKRSVTKKKFEVIPGYKSYYRRFIPYYADNSWYLTKPARVKEPSKLKWSKDMEDNFVYLCN